MNISLPRQSPGVLMFQCFLVLSFGLSLYLCLHSWQEKRNLQVAVSRLKQQGEQLRYAKDIMNRYENFLAGHPFYQKTMNLKWEQVSEVWDDPSYEALMNRLVGLYQADRPFVLENFTAGLVKKRLDAGEVGVSEETVGRRENSGQRKPLQRVFHLKGYFLCRSR